MPSMETQGLEAEWGRYKEDGGKGGNLGGLGKGGSSGFAT